MNQNYIRIDESDNVIVAVQELSKGQKIAIDNIQIEVLETIPVGHKMAIRKIEAEEDVVKYGYSIGKAVHAISAGSWIHLHNVKSGLKGVLQYRYQPIAKESTENSSTPTFMGYVRENGEVGIRNEIWILNTVGCINKTCEAIVRESSMLFKDRNIDGIYHFPHPFGCSQLGDDLKNTQLILSSLVNHSNAAGVLVVGLGCENNHIAEFRKVLGEYDPRRVKFMSAQSEQDELETALGLMEELVTYAETFCRQPVSVGKLKVGLKCGGSDGFSGITANPLVGAFSDLLVGHGGTTILTEVPEMFGAETILMNRAVDETVFEKTVELVNGFKQYFLAHGQDVYENPSPGNKEGGISTLEEKSLGCTQKGGTSQVVDVIPYGHRVQKQGLHLLQAPGNDLVSVTALIAAGAHIVLFTTGRGTPFGGPVPTVKISTNTALYSRKRNWIDFNAGQLIDGTRMKDLKHELFEYVMQIASGEQRTNNETYGYREIAIFKDGVIL